MSYEPVAWMSADGKFNKKETWYFPIPLYTHSAKEKGLPPSNPLPMNQAYLTRSDNYTPHGYVWTSLKDGMETRFTNMYPDEFYKPFNIVPVYTHPAKTLTDEEILLAYGLDANSYKDFDERIIGFARAILRKAQEK